jgi:hypothetical protein
MKILFYDRFAYEAETQVNSRRERDRLKKEIEELRPYSIPQTDIEIEFMILRTMIDGHTRVG